MSSMVVNRRKIGFSFLAILLSFTLLEFVCSTFNWLVNPAWEMFADSSTGVEFCPIRGMKFPNSANRKLTFQGNDLVLSTDDHGNKYGYPCVNEFKAARAEGFARRVLVFGDSFSAGTYLNANWPRRVQEQSHDYGQPTELLNFSQGGIGLANWWSIITRHIVPSHYQFDSIVFAVFGNDLRRSFFMGDGASYGYATSWAPQAWPSTLEEALPLLHPLATRISTDSMGRVIARGPTCREMPFRFVLCESLMRCMRRLNPNRTQFCLTNSEIDRNRQPLIEDIHSFVKNSGVPAMVVFIPTKDRALGERQDATFHDETKSFARCIGAKFIDSTELFTTLPAERKRDYWFERDPHWNQAGSDLFACFMTKQLAQFLPAHLPKPNRFINSLRPTAATP